MKEPENNKKPSQATPSASQGKTKSLHPTKATTKQRVAELKASGFSNIEIGKALQLHRDTVASYLSEIAQKKLVLQAFRSNLGECLHADLLFGMILKHKVLISLSEEDINSLSVADKRQLLSALSVSNGITYDKLRLETGKSTHKFSHEIQLTQVHKSIYWGPLLSASSGEDPHQSPNPVRSQALAQQTYSVHPVV